MFGGLQRIDLRAGDAEAKRLWAARCGRRPGLGGEADAVARRVLDEVRERGDEAVVALTQEFEGRRVDPDSWEVGADTRREAGARLPTNILEALKFATENILRFHRTQLPETTGLDYGGMRLISRAAPLRRVALYVPGGTAAYPSSVLMTAVPAKVAGVAELIMFCPKVTDAVAAAADLAGVDRIFELGGAQAIAAAAVGTKTIPRVDKIVGPGNAYVTAAKRLVFGLCDIDGVAGPSEIVVAADKYADPQIVAADLLSQAEHDPLASSILLTNAPDLPDEVDAALQEQLADLPRSEIAAQALRDHGAAVVVRGLADIINAINAFAPEHVELLLDGAAMLADGIVGAGAIFVGPWTPEAAGDYTAGPSHVLPTAGAARYASPLGVWDFVKYTSVLDLEEDVLRAHADAIVALARAEGLEAHARSVLRRIEP